MERYFEKASIIQAWGGLSHHYMDVKTGAPCFEKHTRAIRTPPAGHGDRWGNMWLSAQLWAYRQQGFPHICLKAHRIFPEPASRGRHLLLGFDFHRQRKRPRQLSRRNCDLRTFGDSQSRKLRQGFSDISIQQSLCPGDSIVLTSSAKNQSLVIQLDDAVSLALVFFTEGVCAERSIGREESDYSTKSFLGESYLLTARTAYKFEIAAYKNLAKNE